MILDARKTPPSAAHMPASVKMMTLVRSTPMPAMRVARSLPPMEEIVRPNTVRLCRK